MSEDESSDNNNPSSKTDTSSPMSYFANEDHEGKVFEFKDTWQYKERLSEKKSSRDTEEYFHFSVPVESLDDPLNLEPDENGFCTLKHPEDNYKPAIRIRVHHPDEDCHKARKDLENRDDITETDLNGLLEPLNDLPGLGAIKKELRSTIQYAYIVKKRKEQGLNTKFAGCHMLFVGRPGTGKTHVARLIGDIFYEIGLLDKGHVLEADRSHLTGEYIGWSESKTQLLCQAAFGGVLFIDEAYSLTDSAHGSDFGFESVNMLTKMMEDHADKFVVIAAGYKDRMDMFIRGNPGLRSRFSQTIEFKDYTASEMADIFTDFCKRYDYVLDEAAAKRVLAYLKSIKGNDLDRFGNARGVRNVFDATIRKQAARLIKEKASSKDDLMLIKAEDIPGETILHIDNVAYLPGHED